MLMICVFLKDAAHLKAQGNYSSFHRLVCTLTQPSPDPPTLNISSKRQPQGYIYLNNLKEQVCPIVTYFIFILQL